MNEIYLCKNYLECIEVILITFNTLYGITTTFAGLTLDQLLIKVDENKKYKNHVYVIEYGWYFITLNNMIDNSMIEVLYKNKSTNKNMIKNEIYKLLLINAYKSVFELTDMVEAFDVIH